MSAGDRFPALRMASRNLRRNRLRTVLAILGISIGVIAIATLGIFGNVLALGADDAVGDIGTQVVVSPNADAGVERLTVRDVETIQRATEGVAVVPLKADGATVETATGGTFATVYGVENPGDAVVAAEGRLPDQHRQGAILGADVAESLDVTVGQTVEIRGVQLRVVAVLEPSETFNPVAPDGAVFLPESAFASEGYDQVLIEASSGSEARAAAEEIRATLNVREERVDVFELAAVVDDVEEFFDLLGLFLIGLGAVSLLVAGVAILNVMLMSTIERRAEIGVMRAVGIERLEVLRILLAEAGLIGTIGAVVGTAATAVFVVAFAVFTPVEWAFVFDPTNGLYLLLALGFGVLVGIVSGLYPAWKAATRPPVEALRE